MVEPSFLGISKTHWDLFNGFAKWFAAIGSIAAACSESETMAGMRVMANSAPMSAACAAALRAFYNAPRSTSYIREVS